ncbi:ion channel, partial [Bifidobacterium pseudocatenulatum]|uniref:potassium channel family protein n=1 Tax=Bifidobacterium pseudocatenulatum TaxID=28026 RepID=UPI00210F0778
GGMAVRGRITLYTRCSVTLLMYIGALAELDEERGVPGASIPDFGEAIWWSFVPVTTVGYGDLSPVTWQG